VCAVLVDVAGCGSNGASAEWNDQAERGRTGILEALGKIGRCAQVNPAAYPECVSAGDAGKIRLLRLDRTEERTVLLPQVAN